MQKIIQQHGQQNISLLLEDGEPFKMLFNSHTIAGEIAELFEEEDGAFHFNLEYQMCHNGLEYTACVHGMFNKYGIIGEAETWCCDSEENEIETSIDQMILDDLLSEAISNDINTREAEKTNRISI